ncbi:MAG: hypothetical protein RPG89_18195 [Microcystis panniformis WG22]|nr:hypothetical protein [Microcystis panniformis WG22]
MILPIQSQPVMRNVSPAAFSGGVEASAIACDPTCAGCNALSGFKKTLCIIAAKSAGCDC